MRSLQNEIKKKAKKESFVKIKKNDARTDEEGFIALRKK
jgi:hypothetical protein